MVPGAQWTPDTVAEVLERAAMTLRRLPNDPKLWPRGYKSSMPAYVQEAQARFVAAMPGQRGKQLTVDRTVVRPALPTAREISDLDMALGWTASYLPGNVARFVWRVALGVNWARLAREECKDKRTLRRAHWLACALIARKINEKKVVRNVRF